MHSLCVKKKPGARVIKFVATMFISELSLQRIAYEVLGGGLFLPASWCRWFLFLVLLLVAYGNTAYMHVDTHTLTPNTHTISLLIFHAFIHSVTHSLVIEHPLHIKLHCGW